jgi:hypothetical protein
MGFDLSALQHKANGLETSLGSLEFWLTVMTGLVVLGLVVEYWHEIPEAISELRKERRWLWKPSCVITGAILITVGVSGELLMQFKASGKETDLRTTNDAIFGSLNTEAAKARKDAGDAIERAANANEQAGIANKSAEEANERAGKANERASELEIKAEELRKENLVLESDLSPRLFKDQSGAIKRLQPFANSQVQLEYLLDPEAKRTAEQINFVLDAAGWAVIPKPASVAEADRVNTETDFSDGVLIGFATQEDESFAARRNSALFEELNRDGIKAFRTPSTTITRVLVVRVGLKPSPALNRLAEESGSQNGPGMLYSAGQRRALPSVVKR